eukprot:1160776-Pelagomonas_calceolata.AAC.2
MCSYICVCACLHTGWPLQDAGLSDVRTVPMKLAVLHALHATRRNPLVKSLQSKLEGQDHFRSILTDQYLEVKGSNGSIFALGDAATIEQPKALSYCEELFDQVGELWLDKEEGVHSPKGSLLQEKAMTCLCLVSAVPGLGCAWPQLCLASAVLGLSCAWSQLCLASDVPGLCCAWSQLCLVSAVPGLGCAWPLLCLVSAVLGFGCAWPRLCLATAVLGLGCAWPPRLCLAAMPAVKQDLLGKGVLQCSCQFVRESPWSSQEALAINVWLPTESTEQTRL